MGNLLTKLAPRRVKVLVFGLSMVEGRQEFQDRENNLLQGRNLDPQPDVASEQVSASKTTFLEESSRGKALEYDRHYKDWLAGGRSTPVSSSTDRRTTGNRAGSPPPAAKNGRGGGATNVNPNLASFKKRLKQSEDERNLTGGPLGGVIQQASHTAGVQRGLRNGGSGQAAAPLAKTKKDSPVEDERPDTLPKPKAQEPVDVEEQIQVKADPGQVPGQVPKEPEQQVDVTKRAAADPPAAAADEVAPPPAEPAAAPEAAAPEPDAAPTAPAAEEAPASAEVVDTSPSAPEAPAVPPPEPREDPADRVEADSTPRPPAESALPGDELADTSPKEAKPPAVPPPETPTEPAKVPEGEEADKSPRPADPAASAAPPVEPPADDVPSARPPVGENTEPEPEAALAAQPAERVKGGNLRGTPPTPTPCCGAESCEESC
ncbi:unnamed protein product [Amoebophrya sp. A25]|nr:unnamed protein product [Amoebophrya sp. A25]|eukprot:GSA25T00001250001.1